MASKATAAPPATSSSTPSSKLQSTAATNPRGIPFAPFIDRVEDYINTRADVEPTLKSFQEMIAKYQFMEVNQQRRAAGLGVKIPDIRKTLEVVRFLGARWEKEEEEKEGLEVTFELNDTLFAKAVVGRSEEVYLWLGANVMLAYPIPEAEKLLAEKLRVAQESLANCDEDQDFLREQITTLEVATARVYNWDVAQRRKEREQEEGSKSDKSGKKANG